MRSDFPTLVAPAWTLDLQDHVLCVEQILTQASTPAASAFDPEHQFATGSELLGPPLQLGVADRGRREYELGEHLPEVIERDGVVALFVGVDPDCDHRVLLIVDAVGDVEAVGQSCVE
jgi:hypothetical protein